ncbi:hypothetical protein ACI0FR_03272 [Paenochrobactrum sp. BZR 201-1]
MVDRILLGKENNRHLLRISKPGFDVKNRANPMVFSSENDYLKIHARARVKLNSYTQSGNAFWWGKFSFPPLSYHPLVFYRYEWPLLGRTNVTFPSQDDDIFWGMSCVVSFDTLWFVSSNWDDFVSDIYVNYIVFENRMP